MISQQYIPGKKNTMSREESFKNELVGEIIKRLKPLSTGL
jgi:hypothetical protein